MNRAASFGVGLCLATIIGVNTYELTGNILEHTSDTDERKELAEACLGELAGRTVIVDVMPEACARYVHRFSEAKELDAAAEKPENYQYKLPSKGLFVEHELQAIEDREEIETKTKRAAGLITAIGTFAVSYQFTRRRTPEQ